VLIIGGAGGNGNDGGGGAGGYLDLLMDLYSGANYPIVIGAAGALGVAGTDGGWSYFGSIFALGGGGGGSSVVAGRDGASGGGADRTSNTFGLATLTYGRQGYNGAGSGGSNQNGGGGAASTGWVRNDGNPTDGRGGEGRQWLDGNWYSAGGNVGEDSTVTAGQTPYGSNATANSGCSGGGYLWTSAAGTVIVAIEVV
jgi:hypothetical protein